MSTTIALRQQQENPTSGHIYSLTKEQASLLRILWAALYILLEDNPNEASSVNINEVQNTLPNGTANGKKGKKANGKMATTNVSVRYSKMARKLNEYKAINSASGNTGNNATVLNDKYNESAELTTALTLYTPGELHRALWDIAAADDPDVILLRFLRARKWDIEKTIAMLIATLKWALQTGVRKIIEGGEEGMEKHFQEKGDKGLKNQFISGKSFVRGTDKDGRPVCYVNVRYHKKDEQSQEVLRWFTVYTMETTRLMIKAPAETGCLVFNMSGFSLSNMDFQYVKFMIQCFEAYYPESLGILIIHKAPWVFGGLWKMISPLLDPVVASKIRFTQSDNELLQLIPSNHLISDLGGEDRWEFKYMPPEENENIRMKDEVTKKQKIEKRHLLEQRFDRLTKQWIDEPSNNLIVDERDQVKVLLRQAQLELDPYIRARTYYHRIGVLFEDGTCNWGYSE